MEREIDQPQGAVGEQLRALFQTMRPRQWLPKNGIIFASLVLSEAGLALQPGAIARATFAFVLFSLLSSAAYLFNDLLDIEKDRAHPHKRHRPLPSGRLSPALARSAMFVLLAIALAGSLLLGLTFTLVGALYIVNNLAYNLRIKRLVILDVFSIAAGFVLRALAGAVAVGVPVSPWLYVLTVLLSLFLGISKRRHELLLLEEGRGAFRHVLTEYTAPMLEEMLSVVTASTVIAYSIYTFSAESLPANHSMMLTIPFVIYGIFRYLYLVHSGRDAPPDEMLLADRPLILTIVLWGLTVLALLYGSTLTA